VAFGFSFFYATVYASEGILGSCTGISVKQAVPPNSSMHSVLCAASSAASLEVKVFTFFRQLPCRAVGAGSPARYCCSAMKIPMIQQAPSCTSLHSGHWHRAATSAESVLNSSTGLTFWLCMSHTPKNYTLCRYLRTKGWQASNGNGPMDENSDTHASVGRRSQWRG
jgi:hypothetical protein